MSESSTPTPVDSEADAPARSNASNGTAVFAALLAALAIAGSGFTWYQTQVKQVRSESALAVGVTEIGGQVSRLGDSIARLQSQQDGVVTEDQLGNRLSQIDTELNAAMQDLAGKQQDLQDSFAQVRAEMQQGKGEYLLVEVEQLLKLASYGVVFGDDKAPALAALRLADERLRQLDDPAFATVRSTLNQDINRLQNAEVADVVALSASLQSLSDAVPELPLFNEPPENRVTTQADAPTGQSGWRAELGKVWKDVSSLIRIQRVEQAPVPLLVPEQRYFLNQNLQLQFNKASLALLQRQEQVYAAALQSAEKWILQYFDQNDARVQNVLTELRQLQSENIEVALPTVSASYQALQAAMGN